MMLNKRHNSGFTMIELLVVMSIIGLSLSIVVVNINPSDGRRQLENESRRIHVLVQQMVDEAIFMNMEIGVQIKERELIFLKFNHESTEWENVSKDPNFKKYKLPEFMEMTLIMEDANVFLSSQGGVGGALNAIDPLGSSSSFSLDPDEEPPPVPDVFIFSSGEVTAFELELQIIDVDDFRYQVSGDEIGQIKFTALHEDY